MSTRLPQKPRSLLAQLSLAYSLAVVAMLGIFGIAALLLTIQLGNSLRTQMRLVDARLPEVVGASTSAHDDLYANAPQIVATLAAPGVMINVLSRDGRHAYVNGQRRTIDFDAPPPPGDGGALLGPPGDPDMMHRIHHGPPHHRHPRFPIPPPFLILGALLGIEPIDHHFSAGTVFLWPNLATLGTPLWSYGCALAILAAVAFLSAASISRALTRRAIAPLKEVTIALNAIAAGDFRSQEISFSSRTEIGELAAAYNLAVARVETAFAERDIIEERMRRFIADSGHQIRTPLTVILGYIDILRNAARARGDEQEAIFTTITAEGRRLRSMVNNLVLLMRLEQQNTRKPRTIDLTALVTDVTTSLATLDPQARLRVHLHDEARIAGDIDELREAISNLIENALKYAPHGEIRVTVRQTATQAELEIRDTGPGITAADAPFIFERFFRGTAGNGIEGSGLGLAIAFRAVERAGGTLQLRDQTDEGCCFLLCFPRLAIPVITADELLAKGLDR